MRSSASLLAILLLLPSAASPSAVPVFTRTATFRPLRLSHDELLGVLARLRPLLGAPEESDVLTVVFSSGDKRVQFSTWPTAGDLAILPAQSDEFELSFERPNSPVSMVSLELGDYSRRLLVRGSAQSQVDAVATVVQNDLGQYRTLLGGTGIRLIGALLLLLPAGIFAGVFGAQAATWRKYLRENPSGLITPAVAASVLYGLVLLPPWSAWLPGTRIARAAPSLLERYSPELSLLGVVLTSFFGIREWIRARKARAAA